MSVYDILNIYEDSLFSLIGDLPFNLGYWLYDNSIYNIKLQIEIIKQMSKKYNLNINYIFKEKEVENSILCGIYMKRNELDDEFDNKRDERIKREALKLLDEIILELKEWNICITKI